MYTNVDIPDEARLHAAKAAMHRHFQAEQKKIFGARDLAALIDIQKVRWGLSLVRTNHIVAFLLEKSKLRRYAVPFPLRSETYYVWGSATSLEVLAELKPGGYFSHLTALYLHGLVTDEPSEIYINYEQSPRTNNGTLKQPAIDRAFRRKPRITKAVAQVGSQKLFVLNGKHTGQLGVESASFDLSSGRFTARTTGLERTLIDAVVRPAYSGGVAQVLAAYKKARQRTSVAMVTSLLDQLEHLYPYHQAIGYALEQAGHSSKALRTLSERPQKFDFYLAQSQGKLEYVKHWRLYVPTD